MLPNPRVTRNYDRTCHGVYEYFGGKLLKNAQGWVNQDRLGSVGKFFPYGQERPSATANGKEKFATYFRDSETGLDYAQNRYESPGDGRFLTPDPYQASGGVEDPGSWNRYAYVGGDPINYFDPSGEKRVWVPGVNGEPGKWIEVTERSTPSPVPNSTDCDPTHNYNAPDCAPVPCPPGVGNSYCYSVQEENDVALKFELETSCDLTAAQLIDKIKNNFPSFANFTGIFGPLGAPASIGNVAFGSAPIQAGASIPINITTVPLVPWCWSGPCVVPRFNVRQRDVG